MKFSINIPPKHIRKQRKTHKLREWHSKFAWLPTLVDQTEEGQGIVWFEKYMRRAYWGPAHPMDRDDNIVFTKYSEKTYFKKMLNGEFDETRAEVDSNVTSAPAAGSSSTMSASLSKSVNIISKAKSK